MLLLHVDAERPGVAPLQLGSVSPSQGALSTRRRWSIKSIFTPRAANEDGSETSRLSIKDVVTAFNEMPFHSHDHLVGCAARMLQHCGNYEKIASASKAGAVNLVRALAIAWAGESIRINGIAPSLVDTKMTKVTMDNDERRDRALSRIPLGRFGSVEEMAGVALFLASPLSTYICGQTLIVDGGLTLT